MTIQKYRQILVGLSLVCSTTGCSAAVPSVPPEKVKEHIATLGVDPTPHILFVDAKKQTMTLLENDQVKKTYKISTSKRGLGQQINTFQTPRGLHCINEKIGQGVPEYGIFKNRKYVGTTWKKKPAKAHRKDYISTRILRLAGLQIGFNKGRNKKGKLVDSETRAIYIHGTTMESKLGSPTTKGCVHMSARDVIQLFNEVPKGTLVWIN